MVYANFCFAYLKNPKLAYVYLDRTRHLSPPFDIRFFIYRKDAELKQKTQSESLGSEGLDLLSYIEFQKNFKAARKFHSTATKAIRAFWRILLDDNVDITALPQAFKRIDAAESKAREHYSELLAKYPNSIRI